LQDFFFALTRGVTPPTNHCFQTHESRCSIKETIMIKPLNAPQLSAVKARTGLQSISELVPRLIRQYELQAELMKRRAEQSQAGSIGLPSAAETQQATFAWYE
jgi:hypothetical protein